MKNLQQISAITVLAAILFFCNFNALANNNKSKQKNRSKDSVQAVSNTYVYIEPINCITSFNSPFESSLLSMEDEIAKETGSEKKINIKESISELAEFSVIKNLDKAEIKWSILNEDHTIDYVIEKSKDGKKFSTLINIPCAIKNSNFHEYFETDFRPASYYRLKQITDDNVYHYSEVICIKNDQVVEALTSEKSSHPEISDLQNKDILAVLRDLAGNEFTSKIRVSYENNMLLGIDVGKTIPSGNYLIIASKVEVLAGQKIILK